MIVSNYITNLLSRTDTKYRITALTLKNLNLRLPLTLINF